MCVGLLENVEVLIAHVKSTSMRTKTTVVEGTKPCCSRKKRIKIDLKSQQP